MSLPFTPLNVHVRVTVAVAATAVTGRSSVSLIAAAIAVVIWAAVSLPPMLIATCWPGDVEVDGARFRRWGGDGERATRGHATDRFSHRPCPHLVGKVVLEVGAEHAGKLAARAEFFVG